MTFREHRRNIDKAFNDLEADMSINKYIVLRDLLCLYFSKLRFINHYKMKEEAGQNEIYKDVLKMLSEGYCDNCGEKFFKSELIKNLCMACRRIK